MTVIHPTLTISEIKSRYKHENLNKINVFGVLTYISSNTKQSTTRNTCTSVTIVDNTCELDDKLKFQIFKSDKDKLINSHCEVGDIIRFHRVKVQQFKDQAQGVCNATFSTWLRFKRANDDDYSCEGNNPSSTIDEGDKAKVKQLRDWLKTNPQLSALNEANLTTMNQLTVNALNNTALINEDQLEQAASYMNMQTIVQNPTQLLDLKKFQLKLTSFSNLQREGYFDIICQVCAICDTKGVKFLHVWDGTKANLAVQQDNDFTVESTLESTRNTTCNEKLVLFSKSILDMIFQVYIFDEFISQLDCLEPGDFVLLKNARTNPAPQSSGADLLIKMPGAANNQFAVKYGRALVKLATFSQADQKTEFTTNPEIDSNIKKIHQKGKDLNMRFITEQEFRDEYKSRFTDLNDDTFAEIIENNSKVSSEKATLNNPDVQLRPKKQPSLFSQVDNLMKDDSEMYITDDEDDEEALKVRPPVTQGVLNQNQNILNIPSTLEVDQEQPRAPIELSITIKPRQHAQLDPTEICPDIFKLKRLTNLTYIAPYLDLKTLPGNSEYDQSMPYYTSLKYLAEIANKRDYLKCKVTAKLFNYSISSCPHITSVFVNCKKCNYINFTPFHLASIYQSGTLNNILNNMDSVNHCSSQISSTIPSFTCPSSMEFNEINSDDRSLKNSVNFDLDWLQSVLPADFLPITPTQTLTQINQEDNSIVSYNYPCPRCALNETGEEKMDQSGEDSGQLSLDYIYRFWFVLRDADSKLDPCLIEGDLALKFLESIEPIKFYTNQLKAHQVYKIIHKNFDKKYLFTLETFKLNKGKNKRLDDLKSRRLDVLYKIVNMEELVVSK